MGRLVCLLCALLAASACTFEPPVPGSAATANDATIALDGQVDADGGIEPDLGVDLTPDAEVDAGEPPDADPPDFGLPARTVYFPAAGAGRMTNTEHRATIAVGSNGVALSATSTTHRVQLGGRTR